MVVKNVNLKFDAINKNTKKGRLFASQPFVFP